MVAAICYALLLANRMTKNKGNGDREGTVVFPVMNTRRGRMWKQRQAAWLFQHVGLDATSLLFADEVLPAIFIPCYLSFILRRMLDHCFDTQASLKLVFIHNMTIGICLERNEICCAYPWTNSEFMQDHKNSVPCNEKISLF